ncbi:MAG TPA: immunity 17 family protein [Herpetosiphonaceae bacterium]
MQPWQGWMIIGGGLFSIAGAVLNWNWFMNNRRAWLFVKLFGRNGARIVYVILGLFLCLIGIAALFGR